MITFICNKLGRDKGLEGFKSENIVLHYKILSGAELCTALKNKIVEEAHEVNKASTQQELIAELADVSEVVDGLCNVYGISANDLQRIKKEKKQERGGFKQGLYIETIEMNDDNPKVEHFRASPAKYPEI